MPFLRNSGEPGAAMARWLGKGTWAILDQGLFATSNFVVSILLARWLLPEAYGVFTIAFALYLLVGAAHSGFLSEPMLVFGPSRFRGRTAAYLRTLLSGHVRLTLGAVLVLVLGGGVALSMGNPTLAFDLIILGLAQPLLLAVWLMRRACYVELRPRLAAAGSGLYLGITLGGLFALQMYTLLSVASAFALMSFASLVVALWLGMRLQVRLQRAEAQLRREILRRHWRYGRWAAATGGLGWVFAWASFLIVPVFGGLEAAASFRALMNFAMPAAHMHAALTVLLVPVFVRAIQAGKLRQAGVMATTLVIGAMIAYGLLLGLFGEAAMVWLYGGLYVEHAHLLWLVGAIPVVGALSSMLAAVLQAMERPRLVFWAHAAGATAAVSLGFGLIYAFGLVGALLFHITGDGVNAVIKQVMLRRTRWGEAAPTRSSPGPLEPVAGMV